MLPSRSMLISLSLSGLVPLGGRANQGEICIWISIITYEMQFCFVASSLMTDISAENGYSVNGVCPRSSLIGPPLAWLPEPVRTDHQFQGREFQAMISRQGIHCTCIRHQGHWGHRGEFQVRCPGQLARSRELPSWSDFGVMVRPWCHLSQVLAARQQIPLRSRGLRRGLPSSERPFLDQAGGTRH